MKGFATPNVNPSYVHSFGNLPGGTVYHNAWVKGGDLRPKLRETYMKNKASYEQKALNVGGYAGESVLTPIYVDNFIVDWSRKYTPLTEIIQRKTCQGLTVNYNYISAKGAATFIAEDQALVEADSTYVRGTADIKYLAAVGRVNQIAHMYGNIHNKIAELNGNPKSTGYGNPNRRLVAY